MDGVEVVEEAAAGELGIREGVEEGGEDHLRLGQKDHASVPTAVTLHPIQWVLHATSKPVQNAEPE